MLQRDDIELVYSLRKKYKILICNAHDVHLQSLLTGHEWVIVSPYDGNLCEILHRHSARDPFHRQRGRHVSLTSALDYIQSHDTWYSSNLKSGQKYHMLYDSVVRIE